MVQHFKDSLVGAVSGEKRVTNGHDAPATEGLYWKYESWLKKQTPYIIPWWGLRANCFA